MSFLPKTFNQILSTMASLFVGQGTAITDMNVGSVTRSLMESSAVELERLYMQSYEGLVDAIDTSAYNSFGFVKLLATFATGDLTLTRTGGYVPDITINIGAQFSVPNTTKVYTATATTVWTGGSGATTKTVKIVSGTAGSFGNTPSNSVTNLVVAITGVASCTNAKAIFNGTDDESSELRRQRFASYVASLPRATRSAVEYGGLTTRLTDNSGYVTESATKVHAFEVNTTATTSLTAGSSQVCTPLSMVGITTSINLVIDSGTGQEVVSVTGTTGTTFTAFFNKVHGPSSYIIQGIGAATLVIHNGVGTPGGQATSGTLVTTAQTIIDGTTTTPGYRSAGVKVTVVAATELDTSIKVVITSLFDGYSLSLLVVPVINALRNLVNSLGIGQTLRLTDITAAARSVPGVRDVQIVSPGSNTVATDIQIVVSTTVQASRFPLSTGLDVNIV